MGTLTAFPREDLAPLIDWIAECSSEKASRHCSQHIKEGWAHYFEILGTPSTLPPNVAHFSLPDIYRVISDIPNPEPDWVTPEETSTIIHSLARTT